MGKIDIYTTTASSDSKEKNLHIRGEIFDKYYIPYLLDLWIFKSWDNCIELWCWQWHKLKKLIDAFPWVNFVWLEKSIEMISKAKKKLPETRIIKWDITSMEDISNESKDVVLLFQVLHHLPEEERSTAYQEIIRILKKWWYVVVIASFRPESNQFKQVIWDIIYRFYSVLSQYPVESLISRTNQALLSIIRPSKYIPEDFWYFNLAQKDLFWVNNSWLTHKQTITPRILYNTIPCISDMLIFQKI